MDTIDPFRFVFAFLFVIGLIGLLALALKRYGRARTFLGVKDEASSRIKIVEMRYLDTRRKLALIRRDDVEHLLLLADGREVVIESNIESGKY